MPESDPAIALDRDFLCTTASIYWFTQTIGSSMRFYAERMRAAERFPTSEWRPIEVPTGYAIAPKELVLIPRALAERRANVQRWTILPRGGHFLPAEQPELLVEEYRAFFGPLR